MGKIRVALVGVGNCANALLQGLSYYDDPGRTAGLMHPKIGPYTVGDIEVVAAFDVIRGKVGQSLRDAAYAEPNDTLDFASIAANRDVLVKRGPTLDGLGVYLRERVVESTLPSVDIADALRETGAEVVVNYLPVGSEFAARHYAGAALEAHCAFVNCMPTFIASDREWEARFRRAGLPIVGDDVKSQVGATIVHRALAQLFRDRGVGLDRTMQLNVGGNSDFLNMLQRDRLTSKKISKTQAVTSIAGVTFASGDIHVGPSDHIPWLTDRKWAYVRLEGLGFGGAPLNAELKLEVWDSPNSAGVVVDAIRCAKLALDRGESGALRAVSAYLMKSPPEQSDDDKARHDLECWLQ
jgi:myo-inositol-1-phosphate synthase